MPHKFNAARRHKFDKAQYRVINWAEYNESLRQRGDLTIWVSDEAQSVWSAPRRTSRGGQRRYSDLAIETCLTLRTAYRLGLRQTQGLMGSIGTLMGLDIRVPDFSTLSRRANGLRIAQVMRQAGSVPVHLVVDSTGLKIFGEGEWLAQKHKIKGIRRRWRKLHLGLDLHSGAIVCANLTHDDVGDSTALPGLLDQLDGPVTGFLADGAYDGASTRDLLRHRYGETLDVVIPPPKNAVISVVAWIGVEMEFALSQAVASGDTFEHRPSECGHCVQDFLADLDLRDLPGEAAGFELGADDTLPTADLRFYPAALVVPCGRLPGHAAIAADLGNMAIPNRRIPRRLRSDHCVLRRRYNHIQGLPIPMPQQIPCRRPIIGAVRQKARDRAIELIQEPG